jgi:hypothetical protein
MKMAKAPRWTAGHRHDHYTRRLAELDDEADLDEATAAGADHHATWPVETLLQRLATAPDATPLNEYFALSDLTRAQAESRAQDVAHPRSRDPAPRRSPSCSKAPRPTRMSI